ncbi:MAG: class C sortase [Clostridia bacterium]|nr:class C sortase [Clostridia bacterium]
MKENKQKKVKKTKKKKSGLGSTIALVAIFLVGLCVLLYPTISDFWNEKRQSKAVMNYDELIVDLTPEDFAEYFKKADEYNRMLRKITFPFISYTRLDDEYYSTLDVNGDGMMGYITIDKIKVQLPIYHGTSDKVLNSAVGHLEGSSLPVGGTSTHSVLSAHRGLPSAKLFTNLDKMEIGDIFTITILDRTITYQVDQILIVLPSKIEELYVQNGEDLCTLVTCTPYGINTHRLLVQGKRIENIEEDKKVNVITEAYQIDPFIVTPAVAVPILAALLIFLMVKSSKENKKNAAIAKEKKKKSEDTNNEEQ